MTALFPIPDSWVWTTLGEIADVVGGVTKDSKKQSDPRLPAVPYLRVANVQRGYLDLSNVTEIRVPESTAARLRLQPGDVLLNEGGDRDKLGRGWVWQGQIPNCIHQNHVFRARLTETLQPKLLAWYTNGLARDWFDQNASQSVNLASISLSTIRRLPVPLPPAGEQHRIAATLEDHLSHLDAATSSIQSAQRKQLLLTRRLVDARLDALNTMTYPLLSVLREPLINGRSVPTDKDGFPVLRLTALRDGRLALSERKNGRWTSADAAPFLVRKGDFFISRGNGSLALVGRGALLEEEPDPVAFPDTMIRIRVDEKKISPKFLCLVWGSRRIRAQIEKSARTTAGIHKINQGVAQAIHVPVPNLRIQQQIVGEVREALSGVDHVGSQIQQAVIRAERLRKSLLADAFEGRLADQDPADEPASVLLARIRGQQVARGKRRGKGEMTPQKETLL
jgi:type I restriction enzyme S subunit